VSIAPNENEPYFARGQRTPPSSQLRVKGGCRRQAGGTAGLPPAPEMPCAPRQLRLVPQNEPARAGAGGWP
jgi:hypothetical protein